MEISRKEIEAIKKMSVPEKIIIVEEIWDSIATGEVFPELSNLQKNELKNRISSYHAAPTEGRTWEEIKSDYGVSGK